MYIADEKRYDKMRFNRCGESGLCLPAASRGQSLAEMALAWILKDDVITSVLIGASRPEQVLANIKAIENTTFSEDELEAIDALK